MQTLAARTSSPTDPSAVSFLTKLPPEIRNYVYEILFKRGDRVLLHNADAFHEPYHEPLSSNRYLEDYYHWYEVEVGRDTEFRHDLHEGLALLSSCRQVHDEASGILYSGNTFVISRVQDRDDGGDEHMAGDEEYFQVNYACKWLEQIGSQFSRLKKVIIDTNTMCTHPNCSCGERIELLPLLRLIWKNPDLLKIISFGDASKIPDTPDVVNEAVDRGRGWNDKAHMLNNMLTALAVEDVLDIRKYSFSNRLMSAVSIITRPEEQEEENSYVSMWNGSEEDREEFLTSDEGRPLRWKPWEPWEGRYRFAHLPTDIRERIAGLLLRQPDGVTIDLDSHTIHGLDFDIARTGLVSVLNAGLVASRVNRISVKMTNNKTITDFDGFEKLVTFYHRKHDHPEVLNYMLGHWEEPNPQTIILEIAPAKIDIPGAIRINIKVLMLVLLSRKLHPASTIRITFTPPPYTRAPQQTTIISTEKLLQQVFLLLSELMLKKLEGLPKLPDPTTEKALLGLKRPDLWIDGYGNLLATSTLDLGAPIEFKFDKLGRKELRVLGYSRATTMDWMAKPLTEALQAHDYSSTWREAQLVCLWDNLRKKLYDDWNFRQPPPGLKESTRMQ